MTEPFAQHNAEVAELWNRYAKGTHARVPVLLTFDEQFLLPRWNCSFRQFYQDVPTQIDIRLETQEWIRTAVRQDQPMGLPDAWYVTPTNWMAENEFLGAEVIVQEHDYAWGQPLMLPKAKLLERLQRLDVHRGVLECSLHRQYVEMVERTKSMEFRGRPVRTSLPVTSTHGVFTKAAEIRGLERLCLDLYEDPPFARELLRTVTELLLAWIRTWHELCQAGRAFPSAEGWGLADDSIAMISPAHYEEFVLPCHQRIYSAMTTGPRAIHLCGHAQHLFALIHRELGVTIFNGPGPQIDLVRMIGEIRAPIEIQVEVAHATLQMSRATIEREVRGLLRDEVKAQAKEMLIGYVPKDTPVENLAFFYECGRRYGQMAAGASPSRRL